MRSTTVLSVAFVTAAITVAPAIAAPRPFHDIPNPMTVTSEDTSLEPHSKREPWSPSYGVGPVLVPGFCSETGACERDLQSRAATAMNATVQQGALTQDEANKIIQLLQSSEGVQFLQGLESDTASLHTTGNTNGMTNGTVSHSTRSSKTAVAGTVFGGIGALSTLGNVIASNLHLNQGSKRSVPLFSESVPYYDFTATELPVKRGLSGDSEDIVARNSASQDVSSVFSSIGKAILSLDGEAKRGLSGDYEDLVARNSVGQDLSSVFSSIGKAILSLDGEAKRGLPGEYEDLVARNSAGQDLSSVFSSIGKAILSLDGEAKRGLLEEPEDIVARNSAGQVASAILSAIGNGILTLDGEAKRGLLEDPEDIVARNSAGQDASSVFSSIGKALLSLDGEAKRTLFADQEHIVARNSAGQVASAILSAIGNGILTLDGEAKRALLEDSEMLRRTWLDDLVQHLDQIAVTGP